MELVTTLEILLWCFLLFLCLKDNFYTYFAPRQIETCSTKPVNSVHNEKSDIWSPHSFIGNRFQTVFCYATVIPPLFSENCRCLPSLDALESVNEVVNAYVEEEEDRSQSLHDQLRIEPFMRNVSPDSEANLCDDLNYRISTFKNCPYTDISALRLSRNGWYYCASMQETRCYLCNRTKSHWSRGDELGQFHSSECRMASFTPQETIAETEDLPLTNHGHDNSADDLADNSSAEISLSRTEQNAVHNPDGMFSESRPPYGISMSEAYHTEAGYSLTSGADEGDNDSDNNDNTDDDDDDDDGDNNDDNDDDDEEEEEKLERLTLEVNQSNIHSSFTNANETANNHRNNPLENNFDRPRYPTYDVLEVRISSFAAWPAPMTQTPRDMAIAGFFYAGYGDNTRCFFCGGGLRNWEPGDDPWVEHANHFPRCPFVRQNQGNLINRRGTKLEEQRNMQDTEKVQTSQNTELTALQIAKEDCQDQILCKICMEKNVSIVFLPCGHLACCEDCAPAVRKCPVCRQTVRGNVKTFHV